MRRKTPGSGTLPGVQLIPAWIHQLRSTNVTHQRAGAMETLAVLGKLYPGAVDAKINKQEGASSSRW